MLRKFAYNADEGSLSSKASESSSDSDETSSRDKATSNQGSRSFESEEEVPPWVLLNIGPREYTKRLQEEAAYDKLPDKLKQKCHFVLKGVCAYLFSRCVHC